MTLRGGTCATAGCGGHVWARLFSCHGHFLADALPVEGRRTEEPARSSKSPSTRGACLAGPSSSPRSGRASVARHSTPLQCCSIVRLFNCSIVIERRARPLYRSAATPTSAHDKRSRCFCSPTPSWVSAPGALSSAPITISEVRQVRNRVRLAPRL